MQLHLPLQAPSAYAMVISWALQASFCPFAKNDRENIEKGLRVPHEFAYLWHLG
ncbi:hypothetical protein SAMN05192564_10121 [Paraburkholderia sartisoli]|uniref:Uncharacterized protein n=1 Tax=Paraburkholderia sartisoli TaxID=83784 RepID=A0A1H3XUF9_9BURK|nr:hypothetical protein SAMN05192564_10121 [Paraburkholderia sartisoli]